MNSKVFVAMPAFGMMNSAYTTMSLVALTKALTERGWMNGFGPMSFPDLPDLRAMFLTLWFDTLNATHILFVDADMKFEPDLVLDMIAFDQPLVGCLYPKRTLPIEWVGSGLPDHETVREGGFITMESVGMGVTLIRRDCVQKMIDCNAVTIETDLTRHASGKHLLAQGVKRMIRAFDRIDLPRGRLSEDNSFCYRHRQIGGTVWASINHMVWHMGDYGFAGRYADVLERKDQE